MSYGALYVPLSVHDAIGAHNPGACGAYECPCVSYGVQGTQSTLVPLVSMFPMVPMVPMVL